MQFNIFKGIKLAPLFLFIASFIILFSVFVRVEGIGYSNYQGDEVNTMDFLYEMNDGVLNYLLAQKRGPVQYLINISNVSMFGYRDESQIRLVYSIAGILALITFYLFVRKVYDSSTAFITSVLLAINGLFIAFARITQYQSIMYFLVPIGVLVFVNSINKKDYKLAFVSGLLMSLSVLTHYDTLSVLPFFISIYLSLVINEIYKHGFVLNNKNQIFAYLHFVIFALAFIIPAASYYIPFAMGESFDNTTSSYLDNRLSGGGFMPRTEITLKLITMYIPKFHIWVLFILGILSIISYGKYFKEQSLIMINKIGIKKEWIYYLYLLLTSLILFSSVFSLYPIKPRTSSLLIILCSLAISTLLILNKKIDLYKKAVIIWFLGCYSFYWFIMKDPRTHVYVSFIPLFMIAADGFIKLIYMVKSKYVVNAILGLFVLMLIFISGVNYKIFVDRNPEYPWWDKTFLGWDIYNIKRVRYEKIEGVFGFNNYRGWEQVAGMFNKGCLVGNFKSNEKDSITYFYTRRHQIPITSDFTVTKDVDNAIIVEGPHSWVYVTPKEPDEFVLLRTIKSGDYDVSYIYGRQSVYPDKKLKCDESVLLDENAKTKKL